MTRVRALPFLGALSYFVVLASPGLTTHFAPDDMQNIYRYWIQPVPKLVSAALLAVTGSYRPMGALFYLPIFHSFGLDPRPYRAAAFVLLCVNIWLLYCLGRRVTGSRIGGGMAAVAGGFHGNAIDAYGSTAVVYEVLCFSFLIGAVLYYVRIRERGRAFNWRETGVLILLFAGGLGSKEMAVILPGVLLVWELLFGGRLSARTLLPAALCGLLATGYVAAALYGKETLTGIEDYKPSWTLHQYLHTTRAYAGVLLMKSDMLSQNAAAALWLGLFAVARLFNRRDMVFGAAFALLAFLPLNFVILRDGYALYIPLAGFGIWAGGLIAAVPVKRLQPILFVVCAAALLSVHYPRSRYLDQFLRHAQEETWNVISEYRRLKPAVERSSRVLILDDPFGVYWDMYFITKLSFRDPTLRVAIMQTGEAQPRGDEHHTFDHVFSWTAGRLIQER